MKKLLFKNWLVLMSLVMACGFTACDDNDDNVGTAPIFPEKQEINLAAGGSQEFSFEANTNWSLSSSAIWCVFVKDEVESFVLSGTPGKQTVTVKVTNDAPAHEISVAKLELTMGGEKVVIGEVRREAQGYDLQLFDEEGNPITELEVGYNDFKRFKVKANYRFAVTNKPSWVDLEGNVLVGASNKEVTGGLEVHNNDDDANFGKYAITKEDGYTLTFASEDGKHEEKVPVVFSGMPANDMDITGGPTSNKWSWTISEDGKTFTNGAGVAGGGGTSYNKHVSFTLKAKNDDFKIVMIDEYTHNDKVHHEEMKDEWMQYAIYDKCKINLTADPLESDPRTAYVLAFPSAKYEEIKNDVIGNAFDETGELKIEYERYLLMLATQDVKKEQTDASVTVTAMDNTTWKPVPISIESIDATEYQADEAYSMPQGTYSMYNIDPQMGNFENQEYSITFQIETMQGLKPTDLLQMSNDFSNPNGFMIYMPEAAPTENLVITMESASDGTKKVLVITPNE